MKKIDNSIKITGMIVVTVLIVVLLVLGFISMSVSGETITSNGIATVDVMPDIVSINFNVETSGTDAKEAKNANAEIVDAVVTALIREGFARDEIVTQNFNVYEEFDWSRDRRTSIGFKATHSIKVELSTEDSDKIGEAVDAGIDNGAMLSYINFELSQDLQNEYKAEALKLAAQDARVKAEAVAEGLGVEIGRVISTGSSDFRYSPWMAYGLDETSVNSLKGIEIETEIQPGTREVSAQVSVTYKLK